MPIGVEDRDADIWECLLAIADAVGGDWPSLARQAAVALVAAAKEIEPSLGIRLLADLRTVFGETEAMATTAILAALHAMPEAPWNDLRGKPINDRGLAVRLRQYGVKSKTVRIGPSTTGTPKGYARADLWDAWESYLPSVAARSATSATRDTSPDLQGSRAPDVADVADTGSDVAASNGAGSADKTGFVADVADVAHVAGNGEGNDTSVYVGRDLEWDAACEQLEQAARVCAQCGSGTEPLEPFHNGKRLVLLHTATCKPFWLRRRQSS
jgi:hypothetical protein